MTIVRVWAASAWADGTMHPAELGALRRCIEESELSPEERGEATILLTAPGELDLQEVQTLKPETREGVYRAALGIVRLDREVSEEEIDFLEKLRGALLLDDATIDRIRENP